VVHPVKGKVWQNVFTNDVVLKAPVMHRGGILADDMGLGKTLEMLALVAHSKLPLPTLLVCPLQVMQNWSGQAAVHTPGLNVTIYHGPNRSSKDWTGADVVVTTYATLSSDFMRREAKKGTAPIHTHKWGRVVFDEAHTLRNPLAKQTKAVFALDLKDTAVWMVTGTPIQNSTKDLFALVRTIGVVPFQDIQIFNQRIYKPLRAGQREGIQNLRTLIGCITLRRLKTLKVKDKITGAMNPLIELPKKTVRAARIDFPTADRKLYNDLFAQSQQKAKAILVTKKKGGRLDMMGMLTLLSRLRSLCCDQRLLPVDIIEALQNGKNVVNPADVLAAATKELGSEKVKDILEKLKETSADECCTLLVFEQMFSLEDVIGSHACWLAASTRVTNHILLGNPLSYRLTL
jgi:SWI/SNF-related matrix-associated actin-dependent regulator of chromatin subfamily A3